MAEQMSEAALTNLRKDVTDILVKNGGFVTLGSFWTIFQKEKGYLIKKESRKQLFQLFPDILLETADGKGQKVVSLRAAESASQGADRGARHKVNLQQLQEHIREVLKDSGGQVIYNSFWTYFQNKHRYLPDPADFGLEAGAKRSDILNLADTVCEDTYEKSNRVLKLRSVRPKAAATTVKQPEKKKEKVESYEWVNSHFYGSDRTQEVISVHPKGTTQKKPEKEAEKEDDKWPTLQQSKSVKTKPAVLDQLVAVVNGVTEEMADRHPRNYYSHGGGPYSQSRHGQQPMYVGQHVYPPAQHVHPPAQHVQHRQYVPIPQHYGSSENLHHQRHNRHSSPATRAAPRSRFDVSQDQLESVAEDCIERLAESKEYVSPERIEKLLLQHYGAERLSDINNLRALEHIKVVNEHIRVQCKVNAYIQAFVKVRSIATVHELAEAMKEFAPKGKDFEALQLGPLIKQPLVFQFFKVPQDGEVLDIDTDEILEHLRGYLTANNAWTNRQSDLNEFMKYIMEKRGVTDPYELGVRIRSVALACQVIKKAQRDAGQTIRGYVTHLKDTLENDMTVAFRNFTQVLLVKEPGVCELRQTYLQMPAPRVAEEVMNKWITLHTSLTYEEWLQGTRAVRKDLNRVRDQLSQFLSLLRADTLVANLFKFVICTSQEDASQQLTDVLGLNEAVAQSQQQQQQAQAGPDRPKPATHELVTKTIEYLEKCMNVAQGSLNLSHLCMIEQRLLKDYSFTSFTDMVRDTFLGFMLDNEGIKKYLDECVGGMMGLKSRGGGGGDSAFHASYSDLLDFIRQCCVRDKAQFGLLESALCGHYSVREVKSLGHGSLTHLVSALEKQAQHSSRDSVWYEGALCAKNRSVSITGERKVGIAGHQTKEKALSCLQNCPLLEDLCEWSAWDLVFKPELGDIKDFVQKYGGIHNTHITENGQKFTMTTNFQSLETKPGVFLKITCGTSPEKFADSALAGDVTATCGHLVSLVVSNKGLETTPLALLGNHLKTALFKLQAGGSRTSASSAHGSDGAVQVSRFVLECLNKLPLVMCQGVANAVFLEPLSSVVGSAKSKDLLLQQCRDEGERGRLHLLGFMLGIGSWSTGFQARVATPRDCLEKQQVVDLGMGELVELSDTESESESDADTADSDFFLSDDEITLPARGKTILKKKVEEVIITDQDTADDSSVMEVSDSDDITEVKVVKTVTTDQKADDDSVQLLLSDSQESDGEAEGVVKEETEEGKEEEEEDPHKVVVEQIRREEFGVDVVLSEDGQKLMQKQQERLGRSLDRLSKDLYSKDTHFVLELVQNADDNAYPEQTSEAGAVIPAVKFLVDKDCITVLNNEVGFEERNIRAICDVGRSTKGKHKFGYIGQKGIGFKSVFRVTDCPEIHSGGYHICFDVNSGPTGYILPHWLEQETEMDSSDRWTTRIVLPLKENMQVAMETQSLAARFQDVHPSLLLFLHRLRNLAVINKVENYVTKMQRRDMGNGLVEIRHRGGVDTWLVVRKMLDASNISLQAKSGVEVESTEIALAFPVLTPEQMAAHVVPDKQPVFAFLPLRSYGFRFIVQGDFDVPSSREDVDKDSMWNQWLCNEIHLLFVEALETFKTHPEFDQMEAVCMFLQFIPLEDEILDFFRPVASHILQQLRARPCLPTQPTPGTGIQWKMPSQLVYTKDSLAREVVTSQLLHSHLSLDYLHADVAAKLNPSLMQSLGIQSLSTQHLLEIGKIIIQNMANLSGEALVMQTVQVSKWLACVYRSMDEFGQNDDLMTLLKSLPMILLVDESLVSLNDRGVFFPLDAEERQAKRKRPRDPLWQLERDLNTVHHALMSCLDKVANSQVCDLLEKLGVKRLTPPEILHCHILPVLSSEDWKTKPRELLLAYMVYIKENTEINSSLVNLDELKKAAVVLTNHGPMKPMEEAVHFTPAYGNKIDLQKILPGYDWVLVDAAYLQGITSPLDIQRWQQFFSRLGVLEFLAVDEEIEEFTREELDDSPWCSYKELLPTADKYVIKDWRCQEFISLVAENTQPASLHQQMALLYQLLDQLWDSKYSKYTKTQITDPQGHVLKDVDTSFSMLLQDAPWLPALLTDAQPQETGGVKLVRRSDLLGGKQLFQKCPLLERILAHHVPYLNSSSLQHSSFSSFLKIRNTVSLEFMQELMTHFGRRPDGEADKPRSYFTSLAHMKAVYTYLRDNMPPKALQDFVHDHPMIFIVPGRLEAEDQVVSGLLMRREEVQWCDPTGLFLKYRESLSLSADLVFKPTLVDTYRGLEEFFLQSARVQRSPSLVELTRLLIHIAQTIPQPRALPDVLRLLTVLGAELGDAGSQSEAVVQLLKGQPVLPVRGGKWTRPQDHPMLADDKQLENLFQGKDGVSFMDLGEKLGVGKKTRKNQDLQGIDLDHITTFLQILGVKPLSDCISIEFITESYRPCPEVQRYVSSIIHYIQLALCSNPNFEDIYQAWQEDDIQSKLEALQFGQVGRLDLVYSLRHKPSVVEVIAEKCRLIKDSEFQVHYEWSYLEVNKELARYFSRRDKQCGRELKTFLMELLPLVQNPSRALERFLEEQDFGTLPEGEQPWVVPQPVVVIPPPPPTPPVPEYYPEHRPSTQDQSTEQDGGSGLKAWPPRSHTSAMADGTRPKSGVTQLWPPPAPPKHMDHSSLPENLRAPRFQGLPRKGGERPPSRDGEGQRPAGDHQGERPPSSDHQGERPQGQGHPSGQQGQGRPSDQQGQEHDGQRRTSVVQSVAGLKSGTEQPADGSGTEKPADTEGDMEVVTTESQDSDGSASQEEGTTASSQEEEDVQVMETSQPPYLERQASIGYEVDTQDIFMAGTDSPRGQRSETGGQVTKRLRVDSGQDANRSKGPYFVYSDPVWTQDGSEGFYEDLDSNALGDLPTELPAEEHPGQKEVGLWGELLVKNYLEKLMTEDEKIAEVKWVNEEGEQGTPYDFVMKVHHPDLPGEFTQVYIEVKSTMSNRKAFFEISSQQLKFAEEEMGCFHLYRVFNAGRPQAVRLSKLENLAHKMQTKQIKLCLVV